MASRFKYGGYTHPNNEVNLVRFDILPQRSDRGLRRSRIVQMRLAGEISYCAADQIDWTDHVLYFNHRIDELINVYADDFKDAIYEVQSPNGTWRRTSHVLMNNDVNNISGVQVVARSWPSGDGDEFATCRKFAITLQAEYLDVYSEIVSFSETLQHIGNGGPQWIWVLNSSVNPVQQVLSRKTIQKVYQQGYAVGLSGYPFGAVPGPLLPQYEHEDVRIVDVGSPRFAGQKYTEWPVHWRYFMETPNPISGIPNRR